MARMTMMEFNKKFETEEQCRNYLFQKKWPEGFKCPRCGCGKCSKIHDGRIQCSECHHQTSVTVGTVMEGTHIPLWKWFIAFYHVSQDKRGVSALQLKDMIAVSYKTAWSMLKRIRAAMCARDAGHRLEGIVEFDDAYFGGAAEDGRRGRGTEKRRVFVALSVSESGTPIYAKMSETEDVRCESVRQFALASIKSGSVVRSDGYSSYPKAFEGYIHEAEKYDRASERLKWIHTLIANAKTFLLGTYHGAVRNLDAYLGEFCYRFSRRCYGASLFDRLAIAMVALIPADSKL